MKIKDYITDTTREIKLVIHDQPGETYAVAKPFATKEYTLTTAAAISVREVIQGEKQARTIFLILDQVIRNFQYLRDRLEREGVRTTLLIDGEEITDETQTPR